jgi:flagellar biosynthetic protein FliP
VSRRGILLSLGALLALAVAVLALPAAAQTFSLDLNDGGALTSRIVQLVALLTVLSLAPSILVVVTSFTRIVIVLSLLRSAIGVQTAPPNVVLISLALFLTAFIMAPTFEQSYKDGIQPLVEQKIDEQTAFDRTVAPVHAFMRSHVRESDLKLFMDMGKIEPVATAADVPLRALIPAFMISELKRAFEIGFLIFVPFIVIDMVVASLLMSMGMMMLPPILISLPFKLILFVLVDGWNLVVQQIVTSFA